MSTTTSGAGPPRAVAGIAIAAALAGGCWASRTEVIAPRVAFVLLESAYVAVLAAVILGLLVLAATALPKREWPFVVARIAARINLVAVIVTLLAIASVWGTGNDEFFGKVIVLSLAMCIPPFALWRLLVWRERHRAAQSRDDEAQR